MRLLTSPSRRGPARRAFTLTEVLVAVGVLLVIVLVTGRIFKITTDVTSAGEATIDIMQEAAAIEKRIREDVARMTHNGFLVIHSVGVPNDINIQSWDGQGQIGPQPPLLNPTLAVDATLRCDQLVFFKETAEAAQGWNDFASVGNLPAYPNAQSVHSMVYYGHGIQLPELGPFIPPDPSNGISIGWGHDPYDTNDPGDQGKTHRLSPNELKPWRFDNPALDEDQWLETTRTDYSSSTDYIFQQSQPSVGDNLHSLFVNATQPDARQWILARQQVLLGDDDGQHNGNKSKRQYLNNVPSAKSIFPHDPRLSGSNDIGGANHDPVVLAYGRVDMAAIPIDEVRELLQVSRSSAGNDALNACRRCFHENDVIEESVAFDYRIEERQIKESYGPGFFNNSNIYPPINPPMTYLSQRFFMKDVVTWPRVERTPPSNEKPDQMLAYNMLGSACSSFMVEWTWVEGAGEATVPSPMNRSWDYWPGVHFESGDPLIAPGNGQTNDPPWAFNAWHGQRWFGLRDIERGVMSYEEFVVNYPPVEPLDPAFHGLQNLKPDWDAVMDVTAAPFAVTDYAIDREEPVFGGGTPYSEYWATFGFNQERADLPVLQSFSGGNMRRMPDPSFTPWPTALRITMTLHDPKGVLEQGHVYQFVVPLPSQALGSLSRG
ncbi:MAG: hypothetical protein VX527_10370, partial [Planctomycetota bacterium]|nr:hypothetical protein [Planctomycetota bacterium]